MGQKLGDARNPLLVSVRSGAKFSMPGMMDTILNLGLNDETVEGAGGQERQSALRLRLLSPLHPDVRQRRARNPQGRVRRTSSTRQKKKAKAKLDTDLTAEDLKAVIAELQEAGPEEDRQAVPAGCPRAARHGAATPCSAPGGTDRATHYRKMNKIPDDLGTAVNVQAMVFGNMGDTSATGVGFTRNPATGEKAFYGEFLVNAQGEDVVAGIRTPQPISELEAVDAGGLQAASRDHHHLEKHYRDMQDFEFTIQEGKLYMLQTRNGKRTGPAAVRIAVEMVEEGLITKKEAVLRVEPQQLDQLLHPVLDPASKKNLTQLATGLPASPGAAVGTIVFTADDAVEAVQEGARHPGPQGDRAGRHPRHGSRQGHSHRARRHDQPRGRGGARHGNPLRGGRRSAASRRAQEGSSAWCATARPSR